MPPHIRKLARENAMAWSLVFDTTELHFYIGLAAGAEMPDPVNGLTIEDFLVRCQRIASSDRRMSDWCHYCRK